MDSGEGSDVWEPLTSHAVTAYIRPFIHSNVRARLDQLPGFPGIPHDLLAIHDAIRKYRNRTIAHSQSELVTPLPVAMMSEAGQELHVYGMSVVHLMPQVMAERFAYLLETMERIVDEITEPVQVRLRTWLQTQMPEMISQWKGPEVTHSIDSEFNSTRRRGSVPRFTNYWHVRQSEDGPEIP
jgi:hypothetical protein